MKLLDKLMGKLGYISKSVVDEEYTLKTIHTNLLEANKKQLLSITVDKSLVETNLKISAKQQKSLSKRVDRLLRKQKQYKEQISKLETKLQETKDLNQKQQKTISLLAAYTDNLNNLIDIYKYGYSPSYLESLNPRTVVEMSVKDIKRRRYETNIKN